MNRLTKTLGALLIGVGVLGCPLRHRPEPIPEPSPYTFYTDENEIKERSKLSQKEWVEFTKQIWNIPIPGKGDLAFGEHSAIMPEEIVRRCVRLFTFVGDILWPLPCLAIITTSIFFIFPSLTLLPKFVFGSHDSIENSSFSHGFLKVLLFGAFTSFLITAKTLGH